MASIYDFLARALPTEGRDYKVVFSFADKNDPHRISVRLESYTRIGKVWCEYCSELLKRSPNHEKVVS